MVPNHVRGNIPARSPQSGRLTAILLIVLTCCLSACATLPDILPGTVPVEFELEGRAAVRYGEQGGSTRIIWRHGPAIDDLLINGPLGQGIARIARHNDEVVLTTSEGREFRAADAEALTESVLGWRLPLAGLSDWVRGRPAPARPARVERDEQGRTRELLQDEWLVEYLVWNDALPARMNLSREGARGRIEIRLIVDQWKLAPK
jgi:outer membrane lipoprotein LolB